ncbi:MAG: c-type cytochrome [Betaproteobacteria bacterium]|jgi:cytochrome c|nr:c-type cytochrome [Betaproteobacteria bacterium]
MKRLLALSAMGVFALPIAVAAPDGAALYTEKTCVACHGPNGGKPLLPIYPKVGGQNAAYAEQQMKDIKSGVRANGQAAAMAGIMHLVNDEEIKILATWLETLK